MPHLSLTALILFTFSALGFAAASPDDLVARSDPHEWNKFYEECDDFLVPDFKELTESWRLWQQKANAAMHEVAKLSSQTCPAYFQRKQGDASLKQFSSENSRVGALAAQAGKEGRPISRFLDQKFQFFESDAQTRGRNFTGGRCGRIFAERRAFVAQDLAELEKKILGMEKTCNGIFEKDASEALGRKLASVAAKARHFALAKAPQKTRASTITGETHLMNQARR